MMQPLAQREVRTEQSSWPLACGGLLAAFRATCTGHTQLDWRVATAAAPLFSELEGGPLSCLDRVRVTLADQQSTIIFPHSSLVPRSGPNYYDVAAQ
jgi:hypothetical protein